MIHRIYSTLKSFKEIRFRSGLNILFADKTPKSTARQTRNRAGKSSILEIIHFLTAASCPEDSIFRIPELAKNRFGMEFDLAGQVVRVERSGAKPEETVIVRGDPVGWPAKPEKVNGERVLRTKEWSSVLGALMFKLDHGKDREPYSPTFRSLFPYFVRRMPGGFVEPHLHFVQAKPYTWQVSLTYLLGLDWTIPQQWQQVRDSEDEIKKLRAALGEGDLADIVGKKAHLRTEIASAESAVARFKQRLDAFQVLPDFRDYERRASQLTQELANLSNANTLDEELLRDLENATEEERPPKIADLRRAYKQAGVVLPDAVLRRFDDVQRFHESVVANRKSYLFAEIKAAERRISERETSKGSLDTERRQIMGILSSHGALEQFSRLQADYGRKTAVLELLSRRYSAAEKIEEGLARLRIRRQELLLRLQQDYAEQSAVLSKAIVAFEDISQQLLEKPAKFTPTETTNGPQFNIEVQGERSLGIKSMQIFCFDLMLMQLAGEREISPGFLVHDSHLFDPVDARQVGTALRVGAEMAAEKGFQYVIALNSDKQIEAPRGFDIADFVLSVKLTDATETGGLFGFRFG